MKYDDEYLGKMILAMSAMLLDSRLKAEGDENYLGYARLETSAIIDGKQYTVTIERNGVIK